MRYLMRMPLGPREARGAERDQSMFLDVPDPAPRTVISKINENERLDFPKLLESHTGTELIPRADVLVP